MSYPDPATVQTGHVHGTARTHPTGSGPFPLSGETCTVVTMPRRTETRIIAYVGGPRDGQQITTERVGRWPTFVMNDGASIRLETGMTMLHNMIFGRREPRHGFYLIEPPNGVHATRLGILRGGGRVYVHSTQLLRHEDETSPGGRS